MQLAVFIGRLTAAPLFDQEKLKTVLYVRETSYAKATEPGGAGTIETVVPFTAFGELAIFLKDRCNQNDQVIIEYSLRNNNYEGQHGPVRSFDFFINKFDFGAPGRESREFIEKKIFPGKQLEVDRDE